MAQKDFDIGMFKKNIDSFDDFFLNTTKAINGIAGKYQKEYDQMDKDRDAYIKNVVASTRTLYSNIHQKVSSHPLFDFYNKLIKAGIVFPKVALPQEYTPSGFEDAKNKLNEYVNEFSNLANEMNSYQFSNGMDFSFDGELAIIDGNKYPASALPDLNTKDFDNSDSRYKELILLAINTLQRTKKLLEYLINYCDKSYEGVVRNKANQVLDSAYQDVKNRINQETENLNNSLKEFYDTKAAPFIMETNRLVDDYMTIDNFEMPSVFIEKLNIGHVSYNFKNYNAYKDTVKGVDKFSVVKETLNAPYYLNLAKKGNVLINASKIDTGLTDFIYQLAMQYISSTPYKKMNLALVDIDKADSFDFVFRFNKDYLRDNKLIFGGKPAEDADELRDMLNGLNKKINEIKGDRLAPKDAENIYEYNNISKENTQELYLLIYVDCPKCLDETLAEKLSNLMINGTKCGVFSIIINNTSFPLSNDSYGYNVSAHREFIKKISGVSTVFDYSNKKFVVDNEEVFPNYALTEKHLSAFLNHIKEALAKQPTTKVIPLNELAAEPYDKPNYAKTLKIPVGKDGGEPVYFELDVEGSNISSAIVAGGTGSGKTSFLHSVIMSGAYNYSPDELEFYLIDFKDGVEFSPYARSVQDGGINIPHVSYISGRNKLVDALDILNKIKAEKEYRHACFAKAGANKFNAYHALPDVINHKLPSFPRLVIIIDEYQNFLHSSNAGDAMLVNSCAETLLKLLKDIRSAGISLILSSQNIDIERAALNLIDNRFVFSSAASVLQTAFPDFVGDDMKTELEKEIGLCYMTNKGGSNKRLFKAAYSGNTGQGQQIEMAKSIINKWGERKKVLVISGDTSPLYLYSSNAPFVKFEKMEQDEDYNIPVFVGQSALSNDLSSFNFTDADFCSYIILGEIKKTRKVEASIGLSFLYTLKQFDYDLDKTCLIYLDLNGTKEAIRNPSPFETYKDELADVMTYAVEPDEVKSAINDLYEEYLARKERSKKRSRVIETPKLLIASSFSFINEYQEDDEEANSGLDGSEEDALAGLDDDWGESSSTSSDGLTLEEKIKTLYADGFAYSIFVVIQERRASILNKDDEFAKMHMVICLDAEELDKCLLSEGGDSITIDDLPESYAVIYPAVSKIRPFDFDGSSQEKEFIKKYVKEIE